MKKQKIYLTCSLFPETQEELENIYDVYSLQSATALSNIPDSWNQECEVVVTTSGSGINGTILEKLPAIKLVANFGTGVDLIDLEYCALNNVAVSHTPGVLTEDVADLTLALILATLRKVASADRFVREGRWLKQKYPLTQSIRGLHIGIIGMGGIGQEVARLCGAFDTQIGYYGPNRKKVDYTYYSEIEELAHWADVLVAACPGGKATRGLISGAVLDKLGPQGFLINIARGSVVDEEVLVDRLVTGAIAGAGLDVFANEPNIPEKMLELDNVVLQPHLGSATSRTRMKMGDLVLANVAAYFAGNPLPTPVSVQHLR
jgi:hydroxypyruvate reductase